MSLRFQDTPPATMPDAAVVAPRHRLVYGREWPDEILKIRGLLDALAVMVVEADIAERVAVERRASLGTNPGIDSEIPAVHGVSMSETQGLTRSAIEDPDERERVEQEIICAVWMIFASGLFNQSNIQEPLNLYLHKKDIEWVGIESIKAALQDPRAKDLVKVHIYDAVRAIQQRRADLLVLAPDKPVVVRYSSAKRNQQEKKGVVA
ncbi:MAG: hypothetical protein ACR2NO_01385 [Chloroflexota bacterium]